MSINDMRLKKLLGKKFLECNSVELVKFFNAS